jgi:putative addiction module component (TIGR02574 family)
MSMSSLPPEIRQLPVPVRVQLAEQIWDSVREDEASFQLTDAQKLELDRRLQQLGASPDLGESWELVKRRILGE